MKPSGGTAASKRQGLKARYKKYFGKYRAKVENNVDPLLIGRIQVKIAAMPDALLNWCMPCVPYAGDGVGFYAIPDIGANVWVEFEGGDPNFPIWTGCFWGEGEAPIGTEPPNPLVKVFKTGTAMLVFNDTPELGGITLTSRAPAVDDVLTMSFNAEGIALSAPPATINMSIEAGITLTFPPAAITLGEEGIEMAVPPATLTLNEESAVIEAPAINATAEEAVSIEAGAGVSVEAGAEIGIAAGAAFSMEAAAEASLTAGAAMEVTADADITITAALVMIN